MSNFIFEDHWTITVDEQRHLATQFRPQLDRNKTETKKLIFFFETIHQVWSRDDLPEKKFRRRRNHQSRNLGVNCLRVRRQWARLTILPYSHECECVCVRASVRVSVCMCVRERVCHVVDGRFFHAAFLLLFVQLHIWRKKGPKRKKNI